MVRVGPQVIVEKMMDYLRATSDDVQKLDAVKRIHELAERFAPDMQWFLDTMNQARRLVSQPALEQNRHMPVSGHCLAHESRGMNSSM